MRKDRNTQRRQNTQRNQKAELWEGGAHVQRQWKEKQKRQRIQIQRKFNPAKEWELGVVNDVSSDGKFHKMGTLYPS